MTDPDFNGSTVSLIGIPFDDNSSFEKGPALAPAVIRETLQNGSLNKGTELGINLAENENWELAEDLCISEENDFVNTIQGRVSACLNDGKRALCLGGDHSVSYPIIKAYANVFPDLTILHIDAHSDLYDSFKGNRLSNACPFARVMEQKLCKRLVQVGIRTLNQHQSEQIARFGVDTKEMRDWSIDQELDLTGPIYLSLDIDGIDPAFAPGVSHREPGGLSVRDVINLIHRTKGQLVGADLVEFNPNKDIDGVTAQVCAKLVKELAGAMLWHDRLA